MELCRSIWGPVWYDSDVGWVLQVGSVGKNGMKMAWSNEGKNVGAGILGVFKLGATKEHTPLDPIQSPTTPPIFKLANLSSSPTTSMSSLPTLQSHAIFWTANNLHKIIQWDNQSHGYNCANAQESYLTQYQVLVSGGSEG